MKIKLLAIILSAVIVVGGGTVAGVLIVNNTPENVAIDAITGAFEDLSKREEISPLLNVFKEGSVDVSVDSIKANGIDRLEDGHIKGKLYFSENSFMVEDLDLALDDKSISLDLFVSEDKLYIGENDILDTCLGIVRGEATDDFENSIFAHGSKSDYELSKNITENISKVLEVYDALDIKEVKKDAKKLIEDYTAKLYKIICKYAEFESESDDIRLLSKKTSVRLITITIDTDAAVDIIEAYYDFLCEDDQLVKFLDKHEDSILPMLDMTDDKSLSEAYEELLEEAEDAIDQMIANAETSDEDEVLEIEIATPKLKSDLLKLTVEFDGKTQFVADFGKDGVLKTDKMSITSGSENVVYEISKNDSKKTEANITVNDEEIFAISIDKEDDSFKATINEEVILKGDIKTKGKTTTISLEKIIVDDETISTDVTIILNEKDKMPTPKDDFDRLDDITEEDIETWIENISDLIGANAKETPAPSELY